MFDDLLDDEIEILDTQKGLAVGIDLGTTNSVLVFAIDDRLESVKDNQGNTLHPSVVAWMPDGRRLTGIAAKERRVIDPQNTIYSAKRIIGQPFSSPRVQGAVAALPYQVVAGPQQQPLIVTREGNLEVPVVSSFVLHDLRTRAQAALSEEVVHCVITVPANFSDTQRTATRQAAEAAGMDVLRILNEPTAAAIAYGTQRPMHQRIAVFDLGGGTFDITLLAVRGNLFEVLATGGDPYLGGDDFDNLLCENLALAFLKTHRLDPRSDPTSLAKLREAAEEIKQTLSSELVAEGTIANVGFGTGGRPLSLDYRVSRSNFESLISDVVERSISTATNVLAEAGVLPNQIDEVILVGGSTRVPLVARRVAECFGQEPKCDIDPMEVVARGAALQAQALWNGTATSTQIPVLFDVTPHSLRVATVGGYTKVIVPKNTTLPAEGTGTFFTARDNQGTVQLTVCQGESDDLESNAPIGQVELSGIPAGRRGDIAIQVAFTIDTDGLLQVSAKEAKSGVATSTTLSTVGVCEQR